MPELEKKEKMVNTRLIRNIASQLRMSMTNVFATSDDLAPAEARESDPQLDKYAAIHSMSCYQMLRLISNLSTVADLLERETIELKNDDIAGLCSTVCKKAEHLFEMKGLTLECVCEPSSQIVAIHAELVERMLLELLSNAMKFTPSGGKVEVCVKRDKGQVLLSVSDNGRGIAGERLGSLFDRFLDADRIETAPYGLGLGLYLCSLIARRHDGRILAQSQEGAGTIFTVSLPDRRTAGAELRDVAVDYAGGFNNILMELSDALPRSAFLLKYVD